MPGAPGDLLPALLEAFQASDSETAWFIDRRKLRVVSVRRGVVSDPLLRARDVEDDELRFVEVPAVPEADVHEWIAEFAEGSDDPVVAACLDERAGANARFEERLARAAPERAAEWRRFRAARLRGVVRAWAEGVLGEPLPEGGGLAPEG